MAKKLPKGHFRTKIQTLGVAFVGAVGLGNQVSCRLEYGGLYTERETSGDTLYAVRVARHDFITALVDPLEPSDFDLGPHSPLDDAQRLHLWAMGVGGVYVLTVPESESDGTGPNFDRLTEIQVRFAYQFTECDSVLAWNSRKAMSFERY